MLVQHIPAASAQRSADTRTPHRPDLHARPLDGTRTANGRPGRRLDSAGRRPAARSAALSTVLETSASANQQHLELRDRLATMVHSPLVLLQLHLRTQDERDGLRCKFSKAERAVRHALRDRAHTATPLIPVGTQLVNPPLTLCPPAPRDPPATEPRPPTKRTRTARCPSRPPPTFAKTPNWTTRHFVLFGEPVSTADPPAAPPRLRQPPRRQPWPAPPCAQRLLHYLQQAPGHLAFDSLPAGPLPH